MQLSDLKNQYGFHMIQEDRSYGYPIFRSGPYRFLLIPKEHMSHENLADISAMANFLTHQGIKKVGQLIPTRDRKWFTKVENRDMVLLGVQEGGARETKPLPSQLADFHKAGMRYPFQSLNTTSYERWPEFWSWRIDQLEIFRDRSIEEGEGDEFRHWFLTTYPYFMAMAENAIQYLVDLRIDKGSQESPTVCHRRFHDKVWDTPLQMKKPTDWVIDHPSRDLSEWIRSVLLTEASPERHVQSILQHYSEGARLTTYSIQLIYSRLLFPVHYIEAIEEYYLSEDRNRKQNAYQTIVSMFDKSSRYEDFLKHFPTMTEHHIKAVNWLS